MEFIVLVVKRIEKDKQLELEINGKGKPMT
jgi:hypothetical protein